MRSGSQDSRYAAQSVIMAMADEAGRWWHLQPHVERLQQQVDARLNVHCEPWSVVVGRGLE
jgi:hypothetical protein